MSSYKINYNVSRRKSKKELKSVKGHIKAIEILGMEKISVDKVARLVDVKEFTVDDVTMCYQNKCKELG